MDFSETSIPHSRQMERAQRILDAAADLLQHWGYKRVTIDDIAKQTNIGAGTIYLHWKTKEALFEAVMLREAVVVWRILLAEIRADPEAALLHRFMRTHFLVTRQRPLARALFTGDAKLLGKLAQGSLMKAAQGLVPSETFVGLLRDWGLLRTDMPLAVQAYAFAATITGFSLIEPFLEGQDSCSLEEKAEALAQTIRQAFEPEALPEPATLQEQICPKLIHLLEQVCQACEAQIQARMIS